MRESSQEDQGVVLGSACHPSPRRSSRQTVPRAGQLRMGLAASCHCSYRRHLQTERAAVSLWSSTSAATWPSRYHTRTAQQGPQDRVPSSAVVKWQPAHRNLSVCITGKWRKVRKEGSDRLVQLLLLSRSQNI